MYKGIVKVYREADLVAKTDRYGQVKLNDPRSDEERKAKPAGKILEAEVTADTQESLVKKINTMLGTLDDGD